MASIVQPQVEYARLERQNRVLKWAGLFLFLLCFAGIGSVEWQFRSFSRGLSVGQTKTISANQFTLLDKNGKAQGMLAGSDNGAMLALSGPNGSPGLMFLPGDNGSGLSVTSADGKQWISLDAFDRLSSVNIGANENNGDKIQLTAGDADRVTVSDKAGFQLVLGSASLVKPDTGEAHNTSAANVTLFAKNGHIIWMTPNESLR